MTVAFNIFDRIRSDPGLAEQVVRDLETRLLKVSAENAGLALNRIARGVEDVHWAREVAEDALARAGVV